MNITVYTLPVQFRGFSLLSLPSALVIPFLLVARRGGVFCETIPAGGWSTVAFFAIRLMSYVTALRGTCFPTDTFTFHPERLKNSFLRTHLLNEWASCLFSELNITYANESFVLYIYKHGLHEE